jgi:glyoxylase-like metal-dependent hydrolase (beta-lactamase superfamily II)
VLFEGYVVGERVASTVSYIRDGDARVVVDPGMVPDVARAILDPLAQLGESPTSITDVALTHHHPDHTLNAGLFLGARVHDHWAWYQADLWVDRAADGFALSPSVMLMETPGHSAQDITVLAGTPDGIVALTHLWWTGDGPAEDPHAADPEALHRGRARVLDMASLVVPGHGAAFAPDENTPR